MTRCASQLFIILQKLIERSALSLVAMARQQQHAREQRVRSAAPEQRGQSFFQLLGAVETLDYEALDSGKMRKTIGLLLQPPRV